MTDLIHLTWRAYPALLLILAGAVLAWRSAAYAVRRARVLRDPQRALAIMRGFRRAMLGLALTAVGIAWWGQIGWLFVLALVIAGEELLESTVVITALAHGPGGREDAG